MDKIEQMKDLKAALKRAGEHIRADIRSVCDEDSFVELSALRFPGERPTAEDMGEGVVTGFATIGGYPFYLVAENYEDKFGALTKAGCDKISKALEAAEKAQTPVIYLLHSQGVKVGEGVDVLEGIAQLLRKAAQFKGSLPQYAVLMGEVYGSAAALAAMCDVVFFLKESVLATTSPYVLSAREGKSLQREQVGGIAALDGAGLPSIMVSSLKEAADRILSLTQLLQEPMWDADLNTPVPALNGGGISAASVLEGAIELGAGCCPQIKTYLARVGGISVAAAVLEQARPNALGLRKLRDFAELASCYGLPFLTFVDSEGMEETMAANNSLLLKEAGEYLNMLDSIDTAKISVITGSAIGLSYSLFAAKSAGYDYVFAFASARIALFDRGKAAEIVYAGESPEVRAKAAEYAEADADPVWAAKNGYVDDVIEPQYLRQYLIASLQMLLR